MRKAFNCFDRALKVLLTVMAIAMIVIGFMQVFFRFVLKSPLTWSEEMIRYIFVWTTFLGVPVGVARNGHASFDILQKRCRKSTSGAIRRFFSFLRGSCLWRWLCSAFPLRRKMPRR